ncbi:hypothetical protein [Pseudobutyrivibrio sp. MD2005]|uniref:hypothetical protein n=1 Tax=Pseudobutyrivibrio sp. MD2005 TaxID=1410616 RepID=UPI0004823B07|nr:hypothetical protein [Pseudobutyrivibrio sp. MD2005]
MEGEGIYEKAHALDKIENAAILESVDDVGLASEERLLVDINEAELAAGETGKIAEVADEARGIKEIAEVQKVAESGNIIDNSDRISKESTNSLLPGDGEIGT